MAGYEQYVVTDKRLTIKFDESVKASTLVNENFTVYRYYPDATPSLVAISEPFEPISITRDWISTSRQLTLYWNFALQLGQLYRVEANNLETPFGTPLMDLPLVIIIDGDEVSGGATPNQDNDISGDDYPYNEVEPEDVEDHSIKNPPFAEEADVGEADEDADEEDPFAIVSVTPADIESYQLAAQANGGKIAVEFNKAPAANYLNSTDFKLQRKLLEGVSSWENVNTAILAESNDPIVNIYLPSQDSIPVYAYEGVEEEDTIYWAEGYKYRLTISKYVGV